MRTVWGAPWTVWASWGGVCFLSAGLGTAVTDLGPWYYDLTQPPWKPPDLLFGPAWTIIFALIATSGVHVWTNTNVGQDRWPVAVIYGANLVLNVGWSLLFFTLQRPDWALWEAFVLLASIVGMMAVANKRSRQAALLLVPYFLWVTFATVLTWQVGVLNGPFT